VDTPGLWDVWGEIFTAAAGSISSTNTEKLQVNNRATGYQKRAIGRMYFSNTSPPQQPTPVP
jgi:hypothetical protein